MRRSFSALLCVAMLGSVVFSSFVLTTAQTAGAVDAAGLVSYQAATVSGGVPDSSGLDPDDCALVIQMTGTIGSGLGVYELLDPANSTPTRTYSSTEAVQFVILDGGCDQNIEINSTYTPPPWNGSTGGVVFLGGGTLTLNADIDASGTGFSTGDYIGAGCDGDDGPRQSHPDGRPIGYDGTGGGGGVIGGGGGGGAHAGLIDFSVASTYDSGQSFGGSVTSGGAGGVNDGTGPLGGQSDGGNPGCVGEGGTSAPSGTPTDSTNSGRQAGAGGGGGGSYGGGGGGCASMWSAAYASGGSGGGSWTGGGAGGVGGGNAGGSYGANEGPAFDGNEGNAPLSSSISDADHYLNETDPRLMMGAAGGGSFTVLDGSSEPGGSGGGVIALFFDDVVGNGSVIASNGGFGATPDPGIFSGSNTDNPASGSGGGAGGQILISTTSSVADVTVTANGGGGGPAVIGGDTDISNADGHTGSAGAGGGAGGIWFLGGDATTSDTNTGANNGATDPNSSLTGSNLSNVTWQVVGGGVGATDNTVTVGGTTYSAFDWMTIYNTAGQYSLSVGVNMLDALVATSGISQGALLAAFPDLASPDNPKNAGYGCTPGEGGNGLVAISPPPAPEYTIEKATNTVDSDEAPGETLVAGQTVTWTYVVTVTGGGSLDTLTVTDSVVAAAAIDCDNTGSNVVSNVAAPATVTCTATGVAIDGAYENVGYADGVVDGEALAQAEDPSHYTGEAPSIWIEKTTAGVQADDDVANDGTDDPASTSDGGSNQLVDGDAVTWTFVVTNDGPIPLINVGAPTDVTTTANDEAGATGVITCDWPNSTDAATPANVLEVGEAVTCTASGTVGTGLHENTASVTGDAALADEDGNYVGIVNGDGGPIQVDDSDASGYTGGPASIAIVKTVTGTDDGDTASVVEGQAVSWTFVVTNDGAGNLENVTVSDPVLTAAGVTITCDWTNSTTDPATGVGVLSPTETVECSATSVAGAADLENTAGVTGDPVGGAPQVSAEDPANYEVGAPAIDVVKTTCTDPADVPASCSDGPIIPAGDPVAWLYVIENTGDTVLVDVTLGDDIETTVDATACDWPASSDTATAANVLSVGETVSCVQTGIATAGGYDNVGNVSGVPGTADGEAFVDPEGNPLDAVVASDPSDYSGEILPAITIEKDTNGVQADSGTGPMILNGDTVLWTFEVENTGNVDLANVVVTDVVDVDNGTVPDPLGVVCDWPGSSDAATPTGNLSVGETVTCTAESTAEFGQYENTASVVGTPVEDATSEEPTPFLDEEGAPLANVEAEDPSAYFGPNPAIDIEKDTNGNQADVLGDQDSYSVGDTIDWTFEVENTGNVDLANVVVSDVVTTNNGTVPDPVGVVCDWATSSDPLTPVGNLSVGETVTCTSSSVAAAGQYANNADVVGTPVDDATSEEPTPLVGEDGEQLANVTDEDPSHYYGEPMPAITIEKDTNGNQADVTGDQDYIPIGDQVTWTFEIENTGDVDLANVVVNDVVTTDNGTTPDPLGVVCDWANSSDPLTPAGNLSVGETVSCTSSSTAEPGQYANNADVVGTPVDDATSEEPTPLVDEAGEPLDDVVDEDPSHYYGLVMPEITIEKDTNGFQADTGSGPAIPIGDPVDWTFVVTNTGNVDLANVTVTDAVTTDNGTTPDPAGVVCDWVNSSDPATAAGILSVGETVTCTSSSTAAADAYTNNSSVVGAPLDSNGDPLLDDSGLPVPNVTDEDPSAYFGVAPAIDIEKDTNGNQADVIPDQDAIGIGGAVVWTFVVTNTGNVDLANVTVTDAVLVDNGTTPDPTGVVCDWANSSDSATPAGNLSVDETVTCRSSSTAEYGQYANEADVVGTPVGDATEETPAPLTNSDGDPLGDVVDDDPSHYFGTAVPSIDIEKDTNGFQADELAQTVADDVNSPVTWTYVVTNDGQTDLADVAVGDTVTIDNGTTHDSAVVCDWANSSDATTPAGNLSVGETVTCTRTGTLGVGQYGNNADVTGTPVDDATSEDPEPLVGPDGDVLPDVDDEDPSHIYGGVLPAVDIEKDTNGNQADVVGDQDFITPGDPVVWTFVVTNTGTVDLADVIVTDVVVTDNGTVADPDGVVCDWINSSDAATPPRNLSVGETVSCTSESTAVAGQYANDADVVGTPVADAETADPDDPQPVLDPDGQPLDDVTDEDPSHYFGAAPAIDIEKDTNGNQADVVGDQDTIAIGGSVEWTFVVTNTGNVDLADVVVTDSVVLDNGTAADPAGVVCDWSTSSDSATPPGNLSVGETVTCTSSSTAEYGQYANDSDVVGTPVVDATDETPVPLTGDDGEPLDDVVDDDPSHYFGTAVPSIDIEKDTNGFQADELAQTVADDVNSPVTWTYVVTNDGQTDLADVTVGDTVTIDNGTTHDGAVVCDWATSSDATTPAGNLSVGESVTCTRTGTLGVGQYGNNADVTGTPVDDATSETPTPLTGPDGQPLDDVTDEDPSHIYGGVLPAIDIEKDTNGNQADVVGDQDFISPGDPVVWTFVVTNSGTVDLADVIVTDVVVTDNGTVADPAGVVCDWANSSDAATPPRNLSVGETVTCTSESTAVAGQYANDADVVGTPVADAETADPDDPQPVLDPDGQPLDDVTDEDPSHYFGAAPAIDIEKDTNGNQADVIGDQDTIGIGGAVVWTFVVTNTGNVDLAGVVVSDSVTTNNGTAADPAGVVCDWANSSVPSTPAGNLLVGETVTCTSSSTAEYGQYANDSDVVGTPVDDATSDMPVPLTGDDGEPLDDVVDDDPSHYFGTAVPSIDIEKDTNGFQADELAQTVADDVNSPVTWTYVVTNDGQTDLADVTVGDTVTIDNGTTHDSAVVCDWANSSDATTPAGNLSVGESVTCTRTGTLGVGQYGNNADVTGTPVEDATSEDPTPLDGPGGQPMSDVTDEDPSHIYGGVLPAIDIEKDTNGNQADVVGDQDYITPGDPVVWTFVVTNTGTVDLADVIVTDVVVTDNGTVADPAGVVCDWINSSDAATPPRNLSVGETVTCTSESTAVAGQYANDADVVGTPVADAETADPDDPQPVLGPDGQPLDDVTDDDPSHYYGAAPAIDIEKDTNGNQADVIADQDAIALGDPVVWTFVVTNTGNVDLADVVVSDSVVLDNGTAADPAGVVCDWVTSSDSATPPGNLSVGETVTCRSSSTAEYGQYANDSDVVGTPIDDATSDMPVPLTDDDGEPLDDVVDDDPSHYFGTAVPAIDIEKDTNGFQADQLSQTVADDVDSAVTWTYVVTNTGQTDLADVTVGDTVTIDNDTIHDGAVVCDWTTSSDATTPDGNLSVGETVTCTRTGTLGVGQYGNNSDVTGTPVEDATSEDPTPLDGPGGQPLDDVTDEDPSHIYGGVLPAIDIEKDTNGNQADVVGDQDYITPGDPVMWTFVVTNTGTVDLADVIVTDVVVTDNGTVADPDGVVCDWINSSDAATPPRNLSVGETVSCTSESTAVAGQYANDADVVGTPVADAETADPDDPQPVLGPDGQPLDDVTDDDPSHYYGAAPAIDIEKDTNGNQADVIADQDTIGIGGAVVWTFVVTNTGNVDLADVTVSDVVVTNNGTAAGSIVCDWANSSVPFTPAGNLLVGETVTCTSSSTAEYGQYANASFVAGTPVDDGTSENPAPVTDDDGEPLADVVDDDPSHYFGTAVPAIDIEKDTNGTQADALADTVAGDVGSAVTWTYVVTNTGQTDLADVTVGDTVTIDNDTTHDGAVACDWATSSDPLTADGNLSVGETVTCTRTGTLGVGQYGNNANVTGTPVDDDPSAVPTPLEGPNGQPLGDVVDEDPSHIYGGVLPAIDIEKDTNGNQADVIGDQDYISLGDPVMWTFVVTNTGTVDLADVIVTDTVVANNGTAADPDGVVCDWAASSDAATPARNLSVGEKVTCTSESTAAAGQYANNSDVVGTPVADATTADPDDPQAVLGPDGDPLDDVTDEDPSHYFGAIPKIDIEKDTNGNQADVIGDQDTIGIGGAVVWTFVVTNNGNVDLADVTVSDVVVINNGTAAGTIVCDWANSSVASTPAGNLLVGETVRCTSSSTAEHGQYANDSDVVGTPVVDATSDTPEPLMGPDGPLDDVVDDDPSHYFGTAVPAIDIEKDTNGVQADDLAQTVAANVGSVVTWTYVVTNTGQTALANVTVGDTVTIDNDTTHDGAVDCDWATSSDPLTTDGNLSVGETVTCTRTGTLGVGQYGNNSDVTGTPVDDATSATPTPLTGSDGQPLGDVADEDPSHIYGGALPAIDIEKDTNGNQADVIGAQDYILVGEGITWTFVVTNTGTVDLADVIVTDTVTTDNGTTVDPDGVVCNWLTSSDAATPARNLSVGETVTCTSDSAAAAGQYANNSKVVGTPVADATTADPDNPQPVLDPEGAPLDDVTDEDPSHYFGPIMDLALRKQYADGTNDQEVTAGGLVTYTIEIFNQGNVNASGIQITDYLPAGVELSDADWTTSGSDATYSFANVVLAPGDSIEVDLTAKIVGDEDDDFENEAEISGAVAVAATGEALTRLSGDVLVLADIDSTPDRNNTEDPVDDAIANESGDEDDHDRVGGVTFRKAAAIPSTPRRSSTTFNPPPLRWSPSTPAPAPAPPKPTPPPRALAFTGSNAGKLALAGLVTIGLGGVLVIGVRRRNEEEQA